MNRSETKKSTTKSNATAEAAAPMLTPGDLPPTRTTRGAPAGWQKKQTSRKGKTGQRPKRDQIAYSLDVANELSSSTTYDQDFKGLAPPAATLSFLITNGAKWRKEWQAAKTYLAYVAQQRAAWEDAALDHMDELKPTFSLVTAQNGSVAKKYPGDREVPRCDERDRARRGGDAPGEVGREGEGEGERRERRGAGRAGGHERSRVDREVRSVRTPAFPPSPRRSNARCSLPPKSGGRVGVRGPPPPRTARSRRSPPPRTAPPGPSPPPSR